MKQKLSWFVGIDWGEQSHQVCLCDRRGKVRGERAFPHKGSGLAALVKWLRKQTGVPPARVAVAIERPDGAVVATLLEAGFAVYAVNPRQTSHLRKFISHPGHKNDRRDARMLATTLQASLAGFRLLVPLPGLVLRLRERTRTADRLLQEQVRQCLRIRSALVDYFPQLLEVAGEAKNLGAPFFGSCGLGLLRRRRRGRCGCPRWRSWSGGMESPGSAPRGSRRCSGSRRW